MIRTVYKANGVVYITDNAGTWIVNKGNAPNPYSIGSEFLLKRTWITTDNMCKYGEYSTYEEAMNRVRSIM